jgi:hypothetical protein
VKLHSQFPSRLHSSRRHLCALEIPTLEVDRSAVAVLVPCFVVSVLRSGKLASLHTSMGIGKSAFTPLGRLMHTRLDKIPFLLHSQPGQSSGVVVQNKVYLQ